MRPKPTGSEQAVLEGAICGGVLVFEERREKVIGVKGIPGRGVSPKVCSKGGRGTQWEKMSGAERPPMGVWTCL